MDVVDADVHTCPHRNPTDHDTVGCTDLVATGITYRQLDYWTRAGYLRTTTPRRGSGYALRWPTTEIPVAAAMHRLTAAGLAPAAAARVARGHPLADGITVHLEPTTREIR